MAQEKILATEKNAEKIAKKITGFSVAGEGGLNALIKEVLIVIDAYERSYAANKLRPALTAEVFTGIRRELEKGVDNLIRGGCNKAEPDPVLVKMAIESVGEKAWNERIAGRIYNRGAFDGFMSAFGIFREHTDKTLEALDTGK